MERKSNERENTNNLLSVGDSEKLEFRRFHKQLCMYVLDLTCKLVKLVL